MCSGRFFVSLQANRFEMATSSIDITLPDGSVLEMPSGSTGLDIAREIGPGLARAALGIEVNGEVQDLTLPIEEDAEVRILTWDDPEGRSVYWHSTAHLMAEALELLYSDVKFGIGPPIDEGFYYDVDLGDRTLGDEDLEKIEEKMHELAERDVPYERKPVSKDDALEYFDEKGDPYKIELIEELEDGSITFYEQGEFVDLCRGPHLPSTGYINYPKLLTTAGAYWRGDEDRSQLTRIYGISFPKQSQLEDFLHRREEAKKRDHRRLGRELDLFTFADDVGPGLPLWKPKGAILREELAKFLRKQLTDQGYQPVVTPHIGRLDLYRKSGHYPYYRESQFPPMLEENGQEVEEGYLLKPMNCPHHIQIYADDLHSYRDLPIRLAEFGTVYRHEQSGEVSGLTRVRGFTQDDGHIFCTADQLKEEFIQAIDLTLRVLDALNFEEFRAQISLRDPDDVEKYVGDESNWQQAERAIREAVAETDLEATEVTGEAAFYGPKLDFMVEDALGREWQLGTVQVDYNLPERFELEYVGEDNRRHQPVMIHRAPFGSLERFIGVLIEHCGGDFPVWLAPVQARVLSITDEFNEYAEEVAGELRAADLRVEVDSRSEKIGYKIRDAETHKIPYMLVVGGREAENRTVAVRRHGEGRKGAMSISDCLELINEEITTALPE
jgi:threonyl-tRNA synthetase